MFMAHFILVNIILNVYIGAVICLKKFINNKISPFLSCLIGCSFILPSLLVFVPNMDFAVNIPAVGIVHKAVLYTGNANVLNGSAKDFYLSVQKDELLLKIWILGMSVSLVAMGVSFLALKTNVTRMKRCGSDLFNDCCRELGVNAVIYVSNRVSSPFSFGIMKKCVVVPENVLEYKKSELRCIFLHELIHHKHRDTIVNLLLCILGCIYWFNPVMHIAVNRAKLDMEIYCDYSVVSLIRDYKLYGNTIIRFIENKSMPTVVSSISGVKSNIKIRMSKITEYNRRFAKRTGAAVTLCIFTFMAVSAFAINVFGYNIDSGYKGKIENAVNVDLSPYFIDCNGCFAAYSLADNSYIIYNEQLCRKRVAPNSTYKIAIALNALENRIISNNESFREWDGNIYPFEQWNRGQNLYSAMKYSVNWYFQGIDRQESGKQIASFLEKTDYGNKATGWDRDNYWLENSLKISPIEQVKFLKGIYLNEFGFKSNSITTVLNSLKISDNLYAKTGTGQINGKTCNGWYIGVYDTGDDTYIFALRLEDENGADGERAEKTAHKILKSKGVLK